MVEQSGALHAGALPVDANTNANARKKYCFRKPGICRSRNGKCDSLANFNFDLDDETIR
jgi:hypothetical protein